MKCRTAGLRPGARDARSRLVALGSLGVLGVLALVSACSAPEARTGRPPEGEERAQWDVAPRVNKAERTGDGLRILGETSPGGRVVARGADGGAFAATADARGGFELRLPARSGDHLLSLEVQRGQEAAPAPGRLLILDGERGPVALLAPGSPTRRLDAAPVLGAVDSDGEAMLLSGRAPSGEVVRVSIGAAPPMAVRPDQGGDWRLAVQETGSTRLTVNGRDFFYPGRGGAAPGGRGQEWSAPDGARLWSWLPTD